MFFEWERIDRNEILSTWETKIYIYIYLVEVEISSKTKLKKKVSQLVLGKILIRFILYVNNRERGRQKGWYLENYQRLKEEGYYIESRASFF